LENFLPSLFSVKRQREMIPMTKKFQYAVAPVLVAAILLPIYAVFRFFPFGTGTVSWCDMNQQVIPFLMDLKNILTGKADLFLNLQNAGGMNFWGVFLFFISSPFSFLVLLVDKGSVYQYINILLLLKMMTCAFTASIYFKKRYSNLNLPQVTALSVMYAFCGYTMFYYQNIVWLDMMYLFPLLLLSLHKLAEERKPLCYIIVFSAILTVNFYLSYMVVIFLILSVGIWLFFFHDNTERKYLILLFGLSTLVTGLLTGVVWLPSLFEYLASARTSDLITSLRTGTLITHVDTTLTVVLCTGAILAAVAMAVVTKIFRENRVKLLLVMLAATLIPVFLEPINKMWHTGSYQSFPVRYGYMPIFIGLILLAECISSLNRNSNGLQTNYNSTGSVITAAIALIAVIFCAYTILRYEFKTVTVYTMTLWGDQNSFKRLFLFAMAVGFVYLILMLQFHYHQVKKPLFSIFLCVLTVVEAVFYSSVYIGSAGSNAQYYTPIMDLSDHINDDSLYRVKMKEKYFDVNLVGSMGYNSLSHYTSLTSKQYMFAMKKLGYSSYWMEVNSNGGTKLTDALLGNKYIITRTDDVIEEQMNTGKTKNPVYSNGLYSIVKNDNDTPFGFVMKSDNISKLKNLPNFMRLQLQQYLFETAFSTKQELIQQYQPTSMTNVTLKKDDNYKFLLNNQGNVGNIRYEIAVHGTQTLYFDCFDQLTNQLYEHINSSFSITVNGRMLEIEYPTQPQNGLVCLGTFTDEIVVVDIGVLRNVYAKSFGIAGLKEDVLSSALASVSKADLHQSGNSISGTAAAEEDGEYLFLPVSYSKGFQATVNGKSAEVYQVFDSFMAVKLEKGQNQISVIYIPQGFMPGLILTFVGVGCAFLLEFFRRRGLLYRLKRTQTVFQALFAGLLVCTISAIYIMPLIIFFT
jgi:uncharacterized membrane protein YfhO